ncbi:helix-turn-helix domain-containing protein [Marinobacterium stanieri]|uniref:AraC family transcriptional regulator n=1 Tax=Marinobacterium stanieri TaxID=49186 RepID=UPI003A8F5A99
MKDETLKLERCAALPFVEMRLASQSCACYQAHSHDEFSFGVIDQGAADYRNGGAQHRVASGTLVTINPADVHSCNPDEGLWSYRMLFVDTQWIGELQRECLGGQTDYRAFEAHYQSDPGFYNRFSALYQTLSLDNDPLAAESELIEFLQPLFQVTNADNPRLTAQRAPEIRRVTELIMDHLADPLPLEHLCQVSGLNRYQLIRRFKQVHGMAPHAFQLDHRIKQARRLLRDQQFPLIDVAQQLGFADQAHFQRHFRQRTALSPGRYRAFFRA